MTLRPRFNPLVLAALLLVTGGLYAMREGDASLPDAGCEPALARCADSGPAARGTPAVPPLQAETACPNAGYLCAELATRDRIQIQRWRNFEGTLVVHVPRPEHEDPGVATQLQRAAAAGIRTWNGAPFEILTDLRGDRNPHFSVRWTSSLGGSQIGVARTQWSPAEGLSVISIELTTRDPYRPDRISDTQRVRLTAAHEMGHALGLSHSDSRHDVMYPSNTASAVSAQDRRTMEVLYSIPDGTEIIR